MSDNISTKVADRRLQNLVDDGERNDYSTWAVKAKDKLDDLDYWKYIEGPDSFPPVIPTLVKTAKRRLGNELAIKKAEDDAKPWRKGDKTAKSLIVQATPNHKLHLVANCTSAKAAWEALRNEYASPNRLMAITIAQTIMGFKCDAEELSVTAWTARMQALFVRLTTMDSRAMSDSQFATFLSTLLPRDNSWRAFNRTLREKMRKAEDDNAPLTSTQVISLIREEDWSQNLDEGDFVAQISQIESLRKRKAPAINAAAAPPSPTKRAKNNEKKSKLFCTNTGNCDNPIGHLIADCFAHGGGKCGQYPHWWKGPTDIHLPPAQRKKNKANGQRGLNYGTDYPSTNVATASNDTRACTANTHTQPDRDVTASIAQGGFYSLNTLADPISNVTCDNILFTESNPAVYKENACYHDSGANRHIFFDRAVFDNYREIPHIQVKGFGSSLVTSAVGVGDIHFTAHYEGVASEIKLSNVLHVPTARLNLISQGCLERRGIACYMEGGVVKLSLNGKGIIDGRLQANNLYRLNMSPLSRNLADRLSPGPRPLYNEESVFSAVTPRSQDFYTAY